MRKSPMSAITTVPPATRTERPAVAIASTVASSGELPAASADR
jgi:hypothetical protein